LAGIEAHCALVVQQLVDGNDQLVALQVEANGQILGQIGHQRLHIAPFDQLIDGLLFGHQQTVSAPLQGIQNVAYHMQHFVGGSV